MAGIQIFHDGIDFAIPIDRTCLPSQRSLAMKNLAKSVGDRELAWIMLAIVGVIVWGMWGLVS